MSVAGLVLAALLFRYEAGVYATPYTKSTMSVDVAGGELLPVHVNLTFPSLPCQLLSVDALDASAGGVAVQRMRVVVASSASCSTRTVTRLVSRGGVAAAIDAITAPQAMAKRIYAACSP